MSGQVTFVSLGPGDPELISLKGLKALQHADIIFSPSTPMPKGGVASRALDIMLQLGIEKSKVQLFAVPMSKDRSAAIKSYKDVSEEISAEYKKGKNIAVTAEGHAGFYSSSYYIEENLINNHIPTHQIAGIPAFIACGAFANLHIVKQEEELHVVPGVISYDDLKAKLLSGNVLTIMKTSQCEAAIKQVITDMENVTIHYFENVGVEEKEFYTQDKQEVLSHKFPYFSLIIIHLL